MKKGMFHADLDSAFTAKQLEYIRGVAMAPPTIPLLSRQLIPTIGEVPPGAEIYTYRWYAFVGQAEFFAERADDLPSVDTLGYEASVKPYNLGDSYSYSLQELLAAQFANVPLDTRKAVAAQIAIETKLDAIAQLGDTARGLTGLLNLANTTSYTVPNDGSGVTQTWSTKTGAQICRDLHGIRNKIISDTKGIEQPTDIVVPLEQFQLIQSTRYNDYTDASILEAFLAQAPGMRVTGWDACNGAGTGPSDRMVCYRNDPQCLGHVIPQEFTQQPVESRNAGLSYYTACWARTAGVVAYRPLSIAYGDGI